MTIDVYLEDIDETFLEDIDEIIEDTMVDIFIVHAKNSNALERIQKSASEFNTLFYATTVELKWHADENCVGYIIESINSLSLLEDSDKAIFIDEQYLSEEMINALNSGSYRGIIVNATSTHDELENFYVSIGARNISKFETKTLENISMDKIVLQSGYPEFNFNSIFETVKVISNSLFRPEQSIIARATKSSLALFDF